MRMYNSFLSVDKIWKSQAVKKSLLKSYLFLLPENLIHGQMTLCIKERLKAFK